MSDNTTLSIHDPDLWNWDGAKAFDYVVDLHARATKRLSQRPQSQLAQHIHQATTALKLYLKKGGHVASRRQLVHHKLQHAVGHQITIGDVYGALGYIISLLEWKVVDVSNTRYYKDLLLRFCKLCITLHGEYFKERPVTPQGNTPGLPTMACIIWGDVGPSFHSEIQPELKGDSIGSVITTSIPFMVAADPTNLREALRKLRSEDLQSALPGVVFPERSKNRNGTQWGNCAEHPGITVLTSDRGEYRGCAIRIAHVAELRSLDSTDFHSRLFADACPMCLQLVELSNFEYEDKAKDIASLQKSGGDSSTS